MTLISVSVFAESKVELIKDSSGQDISAPIARVLTNAYGTFAIAKAGVVDRKLQNAPIYIDLKNKGVFKQLDLDYSQLFPLHAYERVDVLENTLRQSMTVSKIDGKYVIYAGISVYLADYRKDVYGRGFPKYRNILFNYSLLSYLYEIRFNEKGDPVVSASVNTQNVVYPFLHSVDNIVLNAGLRGQYNYPVVFDDNWIDKLPADGISFCEILGPWRCDAENGWDVAQFNNISGEVTTEAEVVANLKTGLTLVGSNHGLFYKDYSDWWHEMPTVALQNAVVNPNAMDRFTTHVYVGTTRGLEVAEMNIDNWPNPGDWNWGQEALLPNDDIVSVARSVHFLAVGTENNGLYIYPLDEKGDVKTGDNPINIRPEQIDPGVNDITIASLSVIKDRLYVATNKGLYQVALSN